MENNENNVNPGISILSDLSADDQEAYANPAHWRHSVVVEQVRSKFDAAFPAKPEEKPAPEKPESILGGETIAGPAQPAEVQQPMFEGLPEAQSDADRELLAALKYEYRSAAPEAWARAQKAAERMGLTPEQIETFVAGMGTQERMAWLKRLIEIGG